MRVKAHASKHPHVCERCKNVHPLRFKINVTEYKNQDWQNFKTSERVDVCDGCYQEFIHQFLKPKVDVKRLRVA